MTLREVTSAAAVYPPHPLSSAKALPRLSSVILSSSICMQKAAAQAGHRSVMNHGGAGEVAFSVKAA